MKTRLMTLIVSMSLLAGAQTIRQREDRQQDRIAQGVASGQLTPREAARLEHREAQLNRQIARDRRSGGRLTPRERARLAREQAQLSRSIEREKHDSQRVR